MHLRRGADTAPPLTTDYNQVTEEVTWTPPAALADEAAMEEGIIDAEGDLEAAQHLAADWVSSDELECQRRITEGLRQQLDELQNVQVCVYGALSHSQHPSPRA